MIKYEESSRYDNGDLMLKLMIIKRTTVHMCPGSDEETPLGFSMASSSPG